ncbi:hypothetical protein EDD22DRAFT_1029606, partial [Suillus occidentalis]
MLGDIAMECFECAKEQQRAEGYIKLERGFATIPLPGIDIPFHSHYLWAGVMPFRAYLSKKINPSLLNPDMLIGKYIPNLVANLSHSTSGASARCSSTTKRLHPVSTRFKKWDQEDWTSPEQRQRLAYTILVE